MPTKITLAVAILLLFPALTLAIPTEVVSIETPECDPLLVPHLVHELGLGPPFPPEELITAVATFTNDSACPAEDDPEIPNALVVMTNLSPIDWAHVWYVADPFGATGGIGTTISNVDGLVDSVPASIPGLAFKIDMVGDNTPLVFESIAVDGTFESGETWHFIIDDYVNTGGLPPSLFDSIGVAGLSAGGPPSSGSIIAVPVPEPGTFALLLVGIALLAVRSGRRLSNRGR
jgi:hypothetical protein